MQKQAHFKIRGMNRDLSVSAFNSEFAYENKNIRILSTDDNTLLSVTNEKGNKQLNIEGIGDHIEGIPIGTAVLNSELVIFTTDENAKDKKDFIYKVWFEGDVLNGKLLYNGDLSFSVKHPIETLSFYENEKIRKVYWTDGLNPPRVINIASKQEVIDSWRSIDEPFNFVRKLKLEENVEIERNTTTTGIFSPGVLQYALTYFNAYGQESNIFYTSPLYYISYNNRGASPEDKVSNSFNISVYNTDSNFEYLRIYSILRTSIDATPETRRVVDLPIPKDYIPYETTSYSTSVPSAHLVKVIDENDVEVSLSSIPKHSSSTPTESRWRLNAKPEDTKYVKIKIFDIGGDVITFKPDTRIYITENANHLLEIKSLYGSMLISSGKTHRVFYTDNGTSGSTIDPTELLYVGGEEVIYGTMTQKDNTLFFGDITLNRKLVPDSVREFFDKKENKNIEFGSEYKTISPVIPEGLYPYKNQLNNNSDEIKTFKYLETYRFGLQFQHETGKWSEPVWINDVRNTKHIDSEYISASDIKIPVATYTLDNPDVISTLIFNGYKRVRPVVVFPSTTDRECLCQGVLCPTVYNVGDRVSGAPFSQSSWFFRPNLPYDVAQSSSGGKNNWLDRESPLTISLNSRNGVVYNDVKKSPEEEILGSVVMDSTNKGAWAEFRHNKPIPGNDSRQSEIQCIVSPPETPLLDGDVYDTIPISSTENKKIINESKYNTYISNIKENYYIDQSILTFHSPDIEFDDTIRSVDSSKLQLRIVGVVPITSFVGDIDIKTSTPQLHLGGTSYPTLGFYKEHIGADNISRFGSRTLLSGVYWFDEASNWTTNENANFVMKSFVVYPFHRNGSLNNAQGAVKPQGTDVTIPRPSMLSKKKISNLKYSYNTKYLDLTGENNTIYDLYSNNDNIKTGISGISIFDSNEDSLIKIPAQENSGLEDISYYGNVDKILNISKVKYTVGDKTIDKSGGYPIMTAGTILYGPELTPEQQNGDFHAVFSNKYTQLSEKVSPIRYGYDPVRIHYKSTPHAVLALNYTKDGQQRVLPTINDRNETTTWGANYVGTTYGVSHTFWDKKGKCPGVYQDRLNIKFFDNTQVLSGGAIEYGWLWLGELYNPNVVNRFGGQTEEAFENNLWLPCGKSVSLSHNNLSRIASSIQIKWTEGDTYYQRYDSLKTYPPSLEEQNGITEILSFMCETRINIDGRYDRNRGQTSNFAMTPKNFNKLNKVYSQRNNFFNFRYFNRNRINLDNFHNSISWTKTKTAGSLVDTWTNITLASTLDLDGDKGDVRALRRFNNNVIAFQDKGISQILYNENVQISANNGVPIEIANSGKVQGKRYISDKIGCLNKWSICETPNGIYFIDDITKDIYIFNGQFSNLSDSKGFHSWVDNESNMNIWNPKDFSNTVVYYDKINNDVLFINDKDCLAFSEPLGEFSSFYSYEKTPSIASLENKTISINKSRKPDETKYKLWEQNAGDYNTYFDKYSSFGTTVIVNQDMPKDKIFNTVEFRADSFDSNNNLLKDTFDYLEVKNEYQKGVSYLEDLPHRPSSLKDKFRIWRAIIPRDNTNINPSCRRDRIRNPWVFLTLSKNKENKNKTILHDMLVSYFV